MEYNFKKIEAKWQKKWEKEKLYEVKENPKKDKFYCLIEFPYPSGEGLHVGHPRSYTALDIVARKHRMQGKNVLYPIGIIAFLASAIFIAIDPAKRFAEDRNARRWTDVSSILEAILRYGVDESGALPAGIDDAPATVQILGTNASGCDVVCGAKTAVSACLDLSSALVNKYLDKIPYDPYTGSQAFTDYYINKSQSGRIEVGTCHPELGATIFVSR